MKTLKLLLLLFVPLFVKAQTVQYLGTNNNIVEVRNAFTLPKDSLGWGNIRIKNDTFQVKLNGVWVSPSAGGGDFLPKTFSSAQTVNTKGYSLDIANVDGSGDGYIYISANEGRGTSILLIDTSAYISAENVYFDGMLGDSTYAGLDSDGKLIRMNAPSGGSVFAKNGLRKQGDTVKLGLELAPPYTNGLITDDVYLMGGDFTSGDIHGIYIGNKEVTTTVNDISSGRSSILTMQPSSASLANTTSNGITGIEFSGTDEAKITSDVPAFKGLQYNSDHSANYNDRSIPDVGWVKAQMADTNYVGGSTTLTMGKKGYYSFTGNTTTWSLQAVLPMVTTRYVIANMGSGNITINAPTNTLWEAGTTMSSTTVAPGETMVIYSNGTYWTIYN